jgi:lysophospholipase L1-like esterase
MKRVALIFVIALFYTAALAQPPFWNDIQAFKKQDSIAMPAAGQVLFTGSSSFTYWRDVQDYFPGVPIINRGFGGSTLVDLLRYKEEVILKYNPKQVVVYCGENDFAASDTVAVTTVVARFKELFEWTRAKLPQASFAYVSMKPSPSRRHLLHKYEAANNRIEEFLKSHRQTAFIDVFHEMLKEDGTPMTDIFVDDNLHMNARGYAIWKRVMEPYLMK